MTPYIAQPCYPLNDRVLAIFFLSATVPAAPRCLEIADRCSPQYGGLSFLLRFVIHTGFLSSFPHFHILSQSQGWSRPVHTAIPDPTDRVLMGLPPPSLSRSLDLGCVGARRMMFLARFLVWHMHLLSGGPRPARVLLILGLDEGRCPGLKDWDTVDNSL